MKTTIQTERATYQNWKQRQLMGAPDEFTVRKGVRAFSMCFARRKRVFDFSIAWALLKNADCTEREVYHSPRTIIADKQGRFYDKATWKRAYQVLRQAIRQCQTEGC